MSSQSFKVTDSLYDNQRYESIKVEIFYVNNAHLNFEMSIFITFYTGGLRGWRIAKNGLPAHSVADFHLEISIFLHTFAHRIRDSKWPLSNKLLRVAPAWLTTVFFPASAVGTRHQQDSEQTPLYPSSDIIRLGLLRPVQGIPVP